MRVTFWGVRGSTPTPDADKLKVGGNTACVEVEINDNLRIILDMGTGIRHLGNKILAEIKSGVHRKNILLLSHTHWDHLQGFPFFAPIFQPHFDIPLYGPAKANRNLESMFAGQMEYDYWPVKFTQLPAHIHVHELNEGETEIAEGVKVTACRHIHPGVAFGYRIEYQGKNLVYMTDTEHFKNQIDERVVDLSKGTDLLIHDAQYQDKEMDFKLGWGHSSWQQAVHVAQLAEVKQLALFHQDPERSDAQAFEIEAKAKEIFPQSFLAKEGLTIEL